MRSIFLALALFTACASGPTPAKGQVNVAAVRHEINDTIRAQNGDRTIHSMGKVTAERATVYTTTTAGAKQEETWVRDGSGGWKLEGSSAMDAAQPAAATTTSL